MRYRRKFEKPRMGQSKVPKGNLTIIAKTGPEQKAPIAVLTVSHRKATQKATKMA